MLMGAIVYGIRYTVPEYVCTLLVAGGVSMFALLKVIFYLKHLNYFIFKIKKDKTKGVNSLLSILLVIRFDSCDYTSKQSMFFSTTAYRFCYNCCL